MTLLYSMCLFLSLDFFFTSSRPENRNANRVTLSLRVSISNVDICLWSDVFQKLYFIFPLVREVDIRLPSALHLHYNCILVALIFFFLVHRPSASPVQLLCPFSGLGCLIHSIIESFDYFIQSFPFSKIPFVCGGIWKAKDTLSVCNRVRDRAETERLTLGPVVRSCSHGSFSSSLVSVMTPIDDCYYHRSIQSLLFFLVGQIEPPCWLLLHLCVFSYSSFMESW